MIHASRAFAPTLSVLLPLAVLRATFAAVCPLALPWDQHVCGDGGCQRSATSGGIDAATPFNQIANPKLVCCINGWVSGAPGTEKLDCVETDTPTDFETFYNAAGGDAVLDAGLSRPNRLYALDTSKHPIPGFYNEKGQRCGFVNLAGNPVSPPLTIQQQFDLFDWAAAPAHSRPPKTSDIGSPKVAAAVAPSCTFLVRTALEVRCPRLPTSGTPEWTQPIASPSPSPPPGLLRCSAAAEFTVHIDAIDLSDPKTTKRTRFHRVTTVRGPDAGKGSDFVMVPPIDFGLVFRAANPGVPCPSSEMQVDANGVCRIK